MYRTTELLDDWEGRIIKNELCFDVMDEAMIIASMYCLNIFHPGPSGAPAKRTTSLDSRENSIEKAKEIGELGGCGCVPKMSLIDVSKFEIWCYHDFLE